MVDYLGYIYRFTSKRGEQSQGIIVDCHPQMGLFGIRMDNKDSNVTLWIRISEAQLGKKHELLPPESFVQWHNPRLRYLIQHGSIAKMIEQSRQRLRREQDKQRGSFLQKQPNSFPIATRYNSGRLEKSA